MSTNFTACPACGLDLGPLINAPLTNYADDAAVCRACGHGLWFRVETIEGIFVVGLQGIGIVTEQNIMRSLERVREMMSNPLHRLVLLDFEGVAYLSSTILGRLISLARYALEINARLKLCNLRPDLQDLFRITRLEAFFERHPSRAVAFSAFAGDLK